MARPLADLKVRCVVRRGLSLLLWAGDERQLWVGGERQRSWCSGCGEGAVVVVEVLECCAAVEVLECCAAIEILECCAASKS